MNNDLTAFEKIPVKIFHSSEEGSVFIAKEIAALMRTGRSSDSMLGIVFMTYHRPRNVQ